MESSVSSVSIVSALSNSQYYILIKSCLRRTFVLLGVDPRNGSLQFSFTRGKHIHDDEVRPFADAGDPDLCAVYNCNMRTSLGSCDAVSQSNCGTSRGENKGKGGGPNVGVGGGLIRSQ
jgi:hypothetical protein